MMTGMPEFVVVIADRHRLRPALNAWLAAQGFPRDLRTFLTILPDAEDSPLLALWRFPSLPPNPPKTGRAVGS